jgi:hypothetical protein
MITGSRAGDARNGDAGVIIDDSDRIQVIDILAHGQSDSGVSCNRTVVVAIATCVNPSASVSNTTNLLVEK